MCTAIGNVFTRCGQGRADAVYTFFIGDLQDNTQSSWRLIIDGNNSDAAQDISNTESVPLVSTRYPAAAGPSVTASRAVVSDGSGALSASATTSAELAYISGVTSSVQTQLNSKGVPVNGTNNKAVVTDGSGDLATATVSSTELGYLAGVTSSLQDQLDAGGGVSSTNAVFDGNSFGIHFAGEGVFNYKNASSLYQVTHKGSYLKCKWSGGAYLANLNNNGRIDIKDEAYIRMNPRSEPSGASDGSFYYDSTANVFKGKVNGSWVTFSTS